MKQVLMIGAAIGSLALTAHGVDVARAADVATVQVSETAPYGKFLTDSKGVSLYLFEADSDATSSCYDACAEAWPPLLTDGAPTAGEDIDTAKLSTTKRKDGTAQVTYNGWPLYYFAKDQAPGEIKGQDVEGFGAEWYLVSPDGQKVHD